MKSKKLKSETFTGLEKLEELYLGWNKIASLENNALSSLSNLSVLNLRYNKLQALRADTFTGLDNLKTLILNDNDLANIATTVLRDLLRPLQLSLGGNPLQCDCFVVLAEEGGTGRDHHLEQPSRRKARVSRRNTMGGMALSKHR